jgi:hypothetical protein
MPSVARQCAVVDVAVLLAVTWPSNSWSLSERSGMKDLERVVQVRPAPSRLVPKTPSSLIPTRVWTVAPPARSKAAISCSRSRGPGSAGPPRLAPLGYRAGVADGPALASSRLSQRRSRILDDGIHVSESRLTLARQEVHDLPNERETSDVSVASRGRANQGRHKQPSCPRDAGICRCARQPAIAVSAAVQGSCIPRASTIFGSLGEYPPPLATRLRVQRLAMSRIAVIVPGLLGSRLFYGSSASAELWGTDVYRNYRRLLGSPRLLEWDHSNPNPASCDSCSNFPWSDCQCFSYGTTSFNSFVRTLRTKRRRVSSSFLTIGASLS